MIDGPVIFEVLYWSLPRAGLGPNMVPLIYMLGAVFLLYWVLPLFILLFTKLHQKYWLLWSVYYVVAAGLAYFVNAIVGNF
ncbi:MAG: hypothetical protein OEY28_10100, partial [Nitrospira sp.]|nr:hypothetical protein [Nitrospira sp.]